MARKTNGSNSVYKAKDGRWYGQIVIGKNANGTLKYKRFSSEKQYVVIEKMREYQQSVNQTKNVDDCYLEDFLSNYLTSVKKNVLKPASYDRDVRTANLIKKYIGNYTFSQLTTEIIQSDLVNKLKSDDYSYSTIHKVCVLLNECLQYAVDTDRLSKNPCRLVKQPPKKMFEKKEIRWLSEEEIDKFVQAANAVNSTGMDKYMYGLPTTLVIYTGLRCGELAALKWSDINFDNNTITVNKNISSNYSYDDSDDKQRVVVVQNSTKTSEGRVIPLNNHSIDILNGLKNKYGKVNPDGFIINNTDKIVAVDTLSDSYTNIAKFAKIDNPLGIHTLRHTFASLLIKKGVDIKIVSEILGHKDVAFTYNTYVHLLDEQKASAMKLLDEI